MPEKDGWKVWVEVDGVPLQEYQEKRGTHDGRDRVTCFIASEAGKEFKVWAHNTGNVMKKKKNIYPFIWIYMDGIKRVQKWMGGKPKCCSFTRISPTQTRPFVFAKLKLEDSPSATKPDSMCTIRAVVQYGKKGRVGEASCFPAEGISSIPERAKKGAEHCVSLGASHETNPFCEIEKIDQFTPPRYYRLCFQLRVKRACGYIEAPENVDSEVEELAPPARQKRKRSSSVSEYLSREEAEMFWKLQAKIDSGKAVKKEKIEESDPGVSYSCGQVIDLTGD